MKYMYLGSSGLKVSRLALGCMSFGRPDAGRPWALDEDSADAIFRQAVELGITFWDTANVSLRRILRGIRGRYGSSLAMTFGRWRASWSSLPFSGC